MHPDLISQEPDKTPIFLVPENHRDLLPSGETSLRGIFDNSLESITHGDSYAAQKVFWTGVAYLMEQKFDGDIAELAKIFWELSQDA